MRCDEAALDYLADCLAFERDIEPDRAPEPGATPADTLVETEG